MLKSRYDIREVLDYDVGYDDPTSYDEPVAYSPPASHPTTIELYASLGPLRTGDKSRGWPLLGFAAGPGELLGMVDELARDDEAGPGWSALMDPDRAPSWALPWLGQLVGVRIPGARVPGQLYVDTQRDVVKAKASWNRGRLERILTAVGSVLTGNKYVAVHERSWPTDESDYPYRLMIDVLEGEFDSVEDIYTALLTAVPAGIRVHVRVVAGIATWERLHSARPQWEDWEGETWAEIHATDFIFATWVRIHQLHETVGTMNDNTWADLMFTAK